MEYVPIASIIIPPNRQRREFDPGKLAELEDSIKRIGLMHPIVVRNDGRTLVAGERRLKAIKNLAFLGDQFSCHGIPVFDGEIPVIKLSDLSPQEVFEAELSENTVRQDLSWQEKAEAILKLQELRSLQTGKTVSHNDIAEEVHGQRGQHFGAQVREQIIVAKHLTNPEVAKAKNLGEAMKILKTRERQAEFKTIGATLPPEILKSKHRLIVGDFQTADLPLDTFTVTITDPPYGIGAETFSGSGSNSMGALAGHTYDDSPEEWANLMRNLSLKLWGVGAPNSHHYVFCDFERFVELRSIMKSFGFRVFSTPFIMYRTTSTRCPWQGQGPWKSYETILYAIKGERMCNMYRHDVIICRGDSNMGNSAQKPVSVYEDLLQRSAKPGDQVLDLCCGTGTIFPAAHATKCIATGIELNPMNAAMAESRLKGLDDVNFGSVEGSLGL